MFVGILSVFVLLVAIVKCHPSGAPTTTYICKEMFPVGHQVDSMFDDPPYEITLSQNVYKPWEEIVVTLEGKRGYHISGFMMQARRANCSHKIQHEPLGTFQLLPNEKYLKTMPCMNRMNSSISHRRNPGLLKAAFKWFAPAAHLGGIYFVATVVYKKETFWTTVYSEILRDLDREGGVSRCPARILLDPKVGPQPRTTTVGPTDKTTKEPATSRTEASCQGNKSPDDLRTNIVLLLCGLIATIIYNL